MKLILTILVFLGCLSVDAMAYDYEAAESLYRAETQEIEHLKAENKCFLPIRSCLQDFYVAEVKAPNMYVIMEVQTCKTVYLISGSMRVSIDPVYGETFVLHTDETRLNRGDLLPGTLAMRTVGEGTRRGGDGNGEKYAIMKESKMCRLLHIRKLEEAKQLKAMALKNKK